MSARSNQSESASVPAAGSAEAVAPTLAAVAASGAVNDKQREAAEKAAAAPAEVLTKSRENDVPSRGEREAGLLAGLDEAQLAYAQRKAEGIEREMKIRLANEAAALGK